MSTNLFVSNKHVVECEFVHILNGKLAVKLRIKLLNVNE